MKYYIEDVEVSEQDFERELNDAVLAETEGAVFDYIIDRTSVIVGGTTYHSAAELKTRDPIAYRTSLLDYVDTICKEYMHTFNRAAESEFDGRIFMTLEDDEDDD